MNYAIEQRLRLIEFLLSHYSSVGRKELMDFFGVSAPQASRDFKAYKDLAPSNMLLNQTSKRYIKSDTFEPIYL